MVSGMARGSFYLRRNKYSKFFVFTLIFNYFRSVAGNWQRSFAVPGAAAAAGGTTPGSWSGGRGLSLPLSLSFSDDECDPLVKLRLFSVSASHLPFSS